MSPQIFTIKNVTTVQHNFNINIDNIENAKKSLKIDLSDDDNNNYNNNYNDDNKNIQEELSSKLETVQERLLQLIKDQSKEKLSTIFKLIKNCYEMLKNLEKNMEEEKLLLESYVNKNFKDLNEIILNSVKTRKGII